MNPITFPDLLDILGHDDHISLCTSSGGIFSSQVVQADEARNYTVPTDRDAWFSVNPMHGPPRKNDGRGTVADVTRLAALFADLDAKQGGLRDFNTAQTVVDTLSEILHSRPTAVTLSGNGLQPYWPLDNHVSGVEAVALLRRFGRLVRHVAQLHHGTVDSVYDLTRIFRIPGSFNHKRADEPKAVITLEDSGRPLSYQEIDEALTAYNVLETPEDRQEPGTIVKPTGEWAWANRTCRYTAAMVLGWSSETPSARHPWLVSQATRLAAAHRLKCITDADHGGAVQQLRSRFLQLISTGPDKRAESVGEVADAIAWGEQKIACKSDTQAREELGNHTHDDAILELIAGSDVRWTPTILPGGKTPQVNGTSALAADPEPEPEPELAPSTLERSEDGHAQQLTSAYRDLIRYCPERGLWLIWGGSRWMWQPKGGGHVREYAKNVARTFPVADKLALAHKKHSLSSQGISGCLRLAETDPNVVVYMHQLDANPYELNTPAGVVDLRTGHILDPDPKSLHTKTTTVAPAVTLDPIWQTFLDDTFGDDHQTRDYVQRIVGVTLLGQVLEQMLAFLHGLGANGKSTFAETLMYTLGVGESGYATAAPSEMLMIRKHSEHPAELAQLAGARMVVCSELDDGQRFAEARIKQLTGRDSINARFLYGQPFTFCPSHTIWLLGNQRPQAKTGGMAFWRRVKLIEFKHVVPADKRDPSLGDKLNAAAGTILAWAIAGAVDYLSDGIREPGSVTVATRAYEEDQDTIGRFVADLIHLSPGVVVAKVGVTELRTAYEGWCTEAGEDPVSARRLTQELRDRWQIDTTRTNTKRFYVGVTLLSAGDDPPW